MEWRWVDLKYSIKYIGQLLWTYEKKRNRTFSHAIEVKLKRYITKPDSPSQIKDRACTVTTRVSDNASLIHLSVYLYAACLSLS